VLPVSDWLEDHYLVTVTKLGFIKKTDLMAYANIRANGLIAVRLEDDDELIGVRITDGTHDILLGTRDGMSIRFNEEQARPLGRNSRGVKAIERTGDDEVVGFITVPGAADGLVLIVSTLGFGKLTDVSEYRSQRRGGKGLMTVRITEKNGAVVGLKLVSEEDHLMLLTSGGKVIRIPVAGIRVTGRVAQGVCLVKLGSDEVVVGVERLADPDDDEDAPVAECGRDDDGAGEGRDGAPGAPPAETPGGDADEPGVEGDEPEPS
jgi:DNA gyrase subunit A